MSYITLNRANYYHNLDILSQKAGDKSKIMAVLKDNAYGHGIEIMAGFAKDFGITKVAVKNLSEALAIHHLFEEVLILADQSCFQVFAQNISMSVHSYELLQKLPKDMPIHLNVDTGMRRDGVGLDEVQKCLQYILKHKLNLKGVFTHYRSSDDLNSEFYWQRELFAKVKSEVRYFVEKNSLSMPKFHSCNSSSLLRSEMFDEDYARCGIATFGYCAIDPLLGVFDLRPVMTLWAERLSSRYIKKGEKVGYGGVYESPKSQIVSTYDIGYGDGFFRYDGLGELAFCDGKTVIGRLSMDSLCVEGEDEKIRLIPCAQELAEFFKTISYDVLSKLSTSIKRVEESF